MTNNTNNGQGTHEEEQEKAQSQKVTGDSNWFQKHKDVLSRLLIGIFLFIILIIAVGLFESFIGTNLLETKFCEFQFRNILYFIFLVIACLYILNKDKSSCTIS